MGIFGVMACPLGFWEFCEKSRWNGTSLGLRTKRQAGQAVMDHAGSLMEKDCGGRSGTQGSLVPKRVRKRAGQQVVMNTGDDGAGGGRARAWAWALQFVQRAG